MNYRLEWRLVGRANRLLDRGEIDEDFANRASALQALNAFLLPFALRGCNGAEGYWWGRRSADADMEVRIVLRPAALWVDGAPASPEAGADQDACSIPISTPINQNGGDDDIRRTKLGPQGRDRSQRADCGQKQPPRRAARGPAGRARAMRSRAFHR